MKVFGALLLLGTAVQGLKVHKEADEAVEAKPGDKIDPSLKGITYRGVRNNIEPLKSEYPGIDYWKRCRDISGCQEIWDETECKAASMAVYGRTNFGTWKIWSPGRTYWGGACAISGGHLQINGNEGDDIYGYSQCQGNANCLCKCGFEGDDDAQFKKWSRQNFKDGRTLANDAKSADRKANRAALQITRPVLKKAQKYKNQGNSYYSAYTVQREVGTDIERCYEMGPLLVEAGKEPKGTTCEAIWEEEECRVASQTVYGRTNFGTWKIWSPGRTYWGGACNIGSGHLSINGNPGDDPDSYSKCQGNANCLCRCRAAGSDPREAQRDARAEAEQKRPGIKAAKEAKKADRKAERQADRQARRHAGAAPGTGSGADSFPFPFSPPMKK